MKKYLPSLFLMFLFAACNPADDKEFSEHCRGPGLTDCSTYQEIHSGPTSGPISWSNTTDSAPPGSGSDKPLFSFGTDKNVDDVPDDDTGSFGNSGQTTGSNWNGTSTGSGPIGGNGNGSQDSPTHDHGDTDHAPGCDTPGECADSGNGNKIPKRDPKGFEHAVDEIGKGLAGLAGELNGSNNKKRKKAHEAKALLQDAKDTFGQVDALNAAIGQEVGLLNGLGLGLGQTNSGFMLNASEGAINGISGRYNAKKDGILNKTPEFDEDKNPATANGGQGVYYENQKIASGRKYVQYARQNVESRKGQPDYEARAALVNMADEAMNASEAAYREGKPVEGSTYHEIGMAFADVALSLVPIVGTAKDAYELATGKSLLDGHQLTTFERSMAGVGIATLGFAKFGAFGKLAKIGGIIAKGSHGAEEAAKIAKGLERGEEIAAAAERAGLREKGLIEEAADSMKQGSPCNFVDNSPRINVFWLFESVAFAADCLPGKGEEVVEEALNESAEIVKEISPDKVKAYLENVENIPRDQVIADMEKAGFKVKGQSPDGKFVEFVDSEGRTRAKIHPADKVGTPYEHLHIYDKEGNSLNKVLEVVSRKSSEAHIPIGGGK